MKQSIRHIAMTVALVAASSAATYAQEKIDKLIQELLENNSVEVIFSEQRDPETREITRSSYNLESKDLSIADRIFEAFQAERPNSINYSQVGKEKEIVAIQFLKEGATCSYSLILDKKSWMLSTNTQPKRTTRKANVSRARSNRTVK